MSLWNCEGVAGEALYSKHPLVHPCWQKVYNSNLPCVTLSYCPFDMAEWRTVWKRLASDVIPLCSPTLLIFPRNPPKGIPLLSAKFLWFSMSAMSAKRRLFGLGSWKISCQIENRLRWESFRPMSIAWTCCNPTCPCLFWMNCKENTWV